MASPPPPPDAGPAEAVFAEFLEQVEADLPSDFEALCRAHPALAKQLRQPVHLELWVKVKDNWADSEQELLRLGYESP